MMKKKMVWVVSVKQGRRTRSRCMFASLAEAVSDFGSHDWSDGKRMYPLLINKDRLDSLPEFNGW